MINNHRMICAGLVLIGLAGVARAAEDPVLKIVAGSARTVKRSELEKKITPAEITVYSMVYQRPMTYQGFWLDEILNAFHIQLSKEDDLVFLCDDGYGTSMPSSDVGRQKWLVAYGEPQGWTPLPERNNPTFPGPWYVVGRDPGSYSDFPWPYQVVTLKIRGDW